MSSIASRITRTHPMRSKRIVINGTAPVMATPLAVGAGVTIVAAAFAAGIVMGANAG
jgi:hypothetical protein